jgi:hypothetical protein
VVLTAGQPLVAAPRRFGTRKNVRSSPPSAMKNVDRQQNILVQFFKDWFMCSL